jgi:hypothetical protein
MSEKELFSALENATSDLEKQVSRPFPGDPCIRYVYEVLKDKKVREAFIRHLKEEDFQSYSCHSEHIEDIVVVFTFRCRPPKICIVAPAFCVHYHLGSHTVTVTDPCIPH